ncbi:transcription-repair coupling factor [Streptococcus sp. DD12]|uniref:transcription-repair coupling factor n=1 Tax=Streptococcus sp. DD12 TaxID=1777880 RepID=UPI000798A9B2|nr:transcription-repair coupling factor [Streptococcus sp. DD12]KXT76116.1 Transcription-repair coupling factor [Streptococcus sp. DD12]
MTTLIEVFGQNTAIASWQSGLVSQKRQLLMGVSGTTKALAIASAFQTTGGKLVVVCANQGELERLSSDLVSLLGEETVYQFFADDVPQAEFIFASLDRALSRVQSLDFLQNETAQGILLVTLAGTRVLLPTPEAYASAHAQFRVGKEYDLSNLSAQLVRMGYERVPQVLSPGEYSIRGDILDIYTVTADRPYRLEFFGDELDGIRTFDSESQKSLEAVSSVTISPASDVLVDLADLERAYQRLDGALAKLEEVSEDLAEVRDQLSNGKSPEESRQWLAYLYEKTVGILDYLPAGTPLIVDDFQRLTEINAKFDLEVADYITERLEQGKTLSDTFLFGESYRTIRQYQPATFLSNFQKGLGNLTFTSMHQINQYGMQDFYNQLPLLVEEIRRYETMKATLVLLVDSPKQMDNLQKSLQSYDIDIPLVQPNQLIKHQAQITYGQLSSGFYFSDEKLVLITEQEIFRKKMKRRVRSSSISNAERLKNYNELQVGDYVVHHIHGIGRFLGMETIAVDGIHRDYLTIQYQQADKISIPVEQLDLLSKYVSADGKEPHINKLNDGRFQRTKQRVAKQVEDIADDLLKLYAQRAEESGFAFSADDDSQQSFEEAFPFVETPDQLQSVREIKKDMEMAKPMDRLLVGDVGFGKTEVAMRAAFKAVNDGKQVAVLVPTTVLAQQHFTSFKRRFEEFPIEVAVLSRFQTKAEQEKTITDLAKGRVDIIIGTHRLLSSDITFKDLGLIVIDEEQRFGVKHKEKLKTLRTKVDVLTLTATPIPRTLHMSMLGIRELSVIETPPTDRYPVQTYVLETDYRLVREGILRELNRGGQVFYVHNRVDTIEQKASELRELVPEASVGVIHGQMSEIQLENTLFDFLNGVYDVLVATTIIETGVDIPNVNTLFIENADHMGLSTLYQLRGRVGRSNRIAYAYLMYRPDKSLTEVQEKRLEAIKGFTELGAGFKVAMRDLSIRGAGNILGASQSGFIDSVGFELYSQLLQEAIAKKQGKQVADLTVATELHLGIDAYLPEDYIPDERQKIDIYKRVQAIANEGDYSDLQDELMDRFGDYPDAVAYLLEIGYLKALLQACLVEKVEKKERLTTVTFSAKANRFFNTQDYFKALQNLSLKTGITEEKGQIVLTFTTYKLSDAAILDALQTFAKELLALKKAPDA